MSDQGTASGIRPGDAIGILGGGQLGRMLALAAADLGLAVHVFSPEDSPPAAAVAARHVKADYADTGALSAFAGAVKAVTFEFENVPVSAVTHLERLCPVRPGSRALAAAQDRLEEKRFLSSLRIPVARFADVSSTDDLAKAGAATGFPAVLKTRRMGYDGKGQAKVTAPEDLAPAWTALGRRPCILEGFVAFDGEASAVLARGADGAIAAYALTENLHKDHILAESRVPARWSAEVEAAGLAAAQRIADALGYIGVLAVEYFVTGQGLIANEIAPRVHNSGHWTIEGAETSQFENHIRAVCGWKLGPARALGPARMINLIGDDIDRWADYLADPGAHVHLYGKREARPGRKMGHVTWVK